MSDLFPILPEAFPYRLSRRRGPHQWDTVQAGDYGPTYDYELENHITKWIVTPVSEAALQWLYCHLPEDCPRYGANSFIVEAQYLNGVVKGMTRDKLMSVEEYEQAMHEAHMIQLQWDDR